MNDIKIAMTKRYVSPLQGKIHLRPSPNVEKSPFRGKKVLDVGCGMGFDVIAFLRAGANAYGLDRIPVEGVPNIIQGDATASLLKTIVLTSCPRNYYWTSYLPERDLYL